MRSRYLLAAAVLLPFVTMPSVAIAGQTYGHWQKVARLAEQKKSYAYYPIWDLRLCSYQGGPKSNTWACRW